MMSSILSLNIGKNCFQCRHSCCVTASLRSAGDRDERVHPLCVADAPLKSQVTAVWMPNNGGELPDAKMIQQQRLGITTPSPSVKSLTVNVSAFWLSMVPHDFNVY
jgi:hypothetical protein